MGCTYLYLSHRSSISVTSNTKERKYVLGLSIHYAILFAWLFLAPPPPPGLPVKILAWGGGHVPPLPRGGHMGEDKGPMGGIGA